MTEEKLGKVIVASTVTAVLLLLILLFIMVYQMIAVSVKKSEIEKLEGEIKSYEEIIDQTQDEIDIRMSKWYIEKRARELGLQYDSDKKYD